MMKRVPFEDPVPDVGNYMDDPEPLEVLASRPTKVTFQWPPQCLWPFFDRPRNGDS
jgi:hypothetical protein